MRHLARILAGASLALVVACEPSPSPSVAPTSETASPTATPSLITSGPTTAATPAPSPTEPPAPGAPDLRAALAALAGHDSYRLAIETVRGRTIDRSEALEILGPPARRSVVIEGSTGATQVIVIGDRAWLARPGAGFAPVEVSEAERAIDGFGADSILAELTRPALGATLRRVGPEEMNGVAATRWSAGGPDLAAAVPDAAPGAAYDVWIAEAGQLVAIRASGLAGADQEVTVDVSAVDDPSSEVIPPG
jgi:hypothetical protein